MDNIQRLPDYLKTKIASIDNEEYKKVREILKKNNLNTVCDGARCPNKCECYSNSTATFLILGNTCTRNCAFCNISQKTPLGIDKNEPYHVALAVKELNLKYCVITSVTRDDLKLNHDFGSIHYQNAINEVRKLNKDVKIEILTPDFKGDKIALNRIIDSKPDVFNHNIETIKRLYSKARAMADYDCSLFVLDYMKNNGYITREQKTKPMLDLLCRLLGRKNIFMLMVTIFTMSSFLCGISTSMPLMVIGRFFQGFGGGILIPIAQAIVMGTLRARI